MLKLCTDCVFSCVNSLLRNLMGGKKTETKISGGNFPPSTGKKNHPRNVKDGYILRWVYLDLRISHVRSRALMTIANQVGCKSLNAFSHTMTFFARSSLSGFLSGCHTRADCRNHVSNDIPRDVASRCHVLIWAMTASKAESRPFSRGG